jgi:hypothetical protein
VTTCAKRSTGELPTASQTLRVDNVLDPAVYISCLAGWQTNRCKTVQIQTNFGLVQGRAEELYPGMKIGQQPSQKDGRIPE